ncbi:alanine racemase [Acinetobacter zhairhuonensis]|uniref:alanine racemase n=1 Tax=Acinetobacter sp. A7.4 TaxID=2919921 RepID=UPI00247ADA84|nr:alanine racemase [Acinetobacter sp. A7.4]
MKKVTLLACMLGAGLLNMSSTMAAPLLTPHISATQAVAPQANAWVEINVQAFEQNIQTLQQQLQDKSQICAVMKADAYGHGIQVLMPSIIKLNVPCVGITSNAEAAMVRQSGYQGRILRLRAATDQEIQNAASLKMEELFGNYEQAQRISAWAKQQGVTVAYHLGLNAGGMDRNGLELNSEQGKQQALNMTKLPNLKLVGIMTHYAVEDEKYVREHLAVFNQQTDWLIKKAKLKREALTLHTANSFATLTVPESHLDMVRAGGVIYGDSIPDRVEYKKLMTFKTQVATVNAYLKGTTVGYDQTYTLKRDSLLANLPMGYSDGYRRAFSNKAYVLIRGHKVPVVGRTSMNTTMVDVTDFPDIRANDEVVLFGQQGNQSVKQSDLEDYNGALLADVYTMWGNSNPKIAVR